MIVMAVRHQRDIDRRQRVERNAGIVATLRSGPADRRGARRPHRIDQDVQPGGLDQPAGVADKRQSHLLAADARRRRVGVRARRPLRPGLPLPAGAELPAQHFAKRFRRHAIGIEKMRAVEMVGHRPGIGFQLLMARLASKPAFRQGGRRPAGSAKCRFSLTFLDFRGLRGLTAALLGKTFFSTRRPALEAGGQRPTARCALGRKSVWNIASALCRDTIGRHHPRKRVIQYPRAARLNREAAAYWIPRFRGV